MKILMVNKFLYNKGGAETYVLSLGKILKEKGNKVEYFGLKNDKNIVGNSVSAYVDDMDFSKGFLINFKAIFRIIYNFQAKRKIRKVLDNFMPDIVHLNNIQYHLTPSIILEVNKWRKKNNHSCKIIYTAHDYQLICPSHGLFDVNVKPCELCLDGKYVHCFKTKCLKNSRIKSFVGMIDGYFWKYSKAYSYIDTIICCSSFLENKLLTQERFKNKTITLHNFKDIEYIPGKKKQGNYIIEFGKLCKDKGTDTLLEVAKQMPEYDFKFVGYGPSVEKMKELKNVEYLGFKSGKELYDLVSGAAVSVVPSEWYENCPFSVIESISLGTPVVGSNIGGIPELIKDGANGELFKAGDKLDLEKKLKKVLKSKEILRKYTENCFDTKYETSESYYKKLMSIYRFGGD